MNMPAGPVAMDGFKDAMSRLASGVSLLTTLGDGGAPLGMLATAVSSVSAEPPTILICINRRASMYGDLTKCGVFCANFLGVIHQDLALRFSSSTARESRFRNDRWETLSTGSPVLVNALASLDCRLDRLVDIGTHCVIFGRVVDTKTDFNGDQSPLTHFNRAYGGWHPVR